MYYPRGLDGKPTFWVETPAQEYISLMSCDQWMALAMLSAMRNPSVESFMLPTDATKVGFWLRVDESHFALMPGLESNRFLYRGENREYAAFVPTGLRYDLSNEGDLLRHLVRYVQKKEFLQIFTETPYFSRCQQFRMFGLHYAFDMNAIAQHYEFDTTYIDVTRSLEVAKFFAYTYRTDKGEYRPIYDFQKYKPTVYCADLVFIQEDIKDILKIIAFQSMLRPMLQQALALDVKRFPHAKRYFDKLPIPHTKEEAIRVYETFEGGAKLLPEKDPFNRLSRHVKNNTVLYRPYVMEYCQLHQLDYVPILQKLMARGYSFTDKLWGIPKKLRFAMDKNLDKDIIPFLYRATGYRKVSPGVA